MKKVLIVSYYWPPAGGISVQRIVKFCKYLPNYGWQPIILTVENGSFIQIDDSYQKDIGHVKHIYRARSLEPHSLYNRIKKPTSNYIDQQKKHRKYFGRIFEWLSDFIRLNLFIPDARIGWYPNAVKTGLKIIDKHNPSLIFSTAPPFSVHLVAKTLSQKTNLPWIADFRDAWLENNLYDKPFRLFHAKLLNKILEKKTLETANMVVSIGENMSALLSSKIPESFSGKFRVVYNGYDNVEDIDLEMHTPSHFYISYYGTLYADRLPYTLLKLLNEEIKKSIDFKNDFKFRVFGNIDNSCHEQLSNFIPKSNLIISKTIDYNLFLQELQMPQVLLLTIDKVPYNELIITGKIFDYMTSGNPIIGVGPINGDAAAVLDRTKAGIMFDYDDKSIIETITEKYQSWKRGDIKQKANYLPEFSRKELTSKLASLFDETIELRCKNS